MDKIELYVWCGYGLFVAIGLIIFVCISCYVKAKIRICETEQAMIRQYNAQLAASHATKSAKNKSNTEHEKETFSLFNLLS
jgi:hypothetical protein